MNKKYTSFLALFMTAFMLFTALLPSANVNAAGSLVLDYDTQVTSQKSDYDDLDSYLVVAKQKPIVLAPQNAKSINEKITSVILAPYEKLDLKFYGCGDYKTTGIGWKSSNTKVCTIDKNGVVTPVATGIADITYEAIGYKCQPVRVLVTSADYNVFLAEQTSQRVLSGVLFTCDEDKSDIYVDLCFLGAKGFSANKHNSAWFSLDENICTINNMGVVTPVNEGETYVGMTITNKADGSVAYNVKPVKVKVTSINPQPVEPVVTPVPVGENPTATTTPEATEKIDEKSLYTVTQKTYDTVMISTENEIATLTCDEAPVISVEKKDAGYEVVFAGPIVKDQTYKLVDNDVVYEFKGMTGEPAEVKLTYTCYGQENAAYADAEVTLSAVVLDKNGIVLPEESFTFTDNGNELYDTVLYMNGLGDRHIITAQSLTSKLKAQVTITATKEPAYALSDMKAVVVNAAGEEAKIVSLSDAGTNFVTIIAKDNRGNIIRTKVGEAFENEYGTLTFGTAGTVAEVMEDGSVFPIKTGTANIVVYFTVSETGKRSPVGQFSFEVKPERKVTQIVTTDDYGKTVSSFKLQSVMATSQAVTIVLKDQYGQAITDDYEITALKGKNETTAVGLVPTADTDRYLVTAFGDSTTDKSSAYTIKITSANNVTKTIPVTVYNAENVTATKSQAIWANTDTNGSLGVIYNVEYAYAAYADCGSVNGATVYTAYENLRGIYDGTTKTDITDIEGQTSTTATGDIYAKITIDGTVLRAADLVNNVSHTSKVLFLDGENSNMIRIALPSGAEKCNVKVEFYKDNGSTMAPCKPSLNNTWKNNDEQYVVTKTTFTGLIPEDEYIDDATWFADYCNVTATILGRPVAAEDIVFVETVKTSESSKYLKSIVYEVDGILHTEVINRLYR